MGLDSVELVMEVEDRFDVKLSDAECQGMRTVADLAALVVAHLPRYEGACPTARAFYEFRALLTGHAGIERERVRPRALMGELFPRGLAALWRGLRERDGRLPRLVMTGREEHVFLWVIGVLCFVWLLASAAMLGVYGVVIALPVAVAVFGIGLIAAVRIGRLLERHFPPGIVTVGDLARFVAVSELPRHGSGERLMAELRVLEEVRRIAAAQLGLPIERVRPESDFVKDLGVD